MYIKNDDRNTVALKELEALLDQGSQEQHLPVNKRLDIVLKAVTRYETWRYDKGAPRKWLTRMPKSWRRPIPLWPPVLTNHQRMLMNTEARADGLGRFLHNG